MTHPIPISALDGKVGVLGVTGSGKTFTAIGMIEQLLDLGRQVIIIDPTGAYHGLCTAFPIPIFGGLNGDVPIDESDGAAIARVIVDRNVSAIVDVSQLLKRSHATARRFMAGFVATLKDSPARARYLVIDEADEFMPENVGGGDTALFGDLKWIVRRGRKDGWRVLMVTQRPQDIAKSVLTQCETMVIHTLTAPQDRKAVEEWVKGHAEPGQAKAVLESLARLQTGEAWIWSPRHDLLARSRMPPNRSADTSKTPDAGDEPAALARLAPAELDELRAALAKPVEVPSKGWIAPSSASTSSSEVARDAELSDLRRQLAALRAERDEWTVERGYGQQQLDELLSALRRVADEARDIANFAESAIGQLGNDEIPGDWPGGGPSGDAGQTEGRQVMMSAAPRAQGPASAVQTPAMGKSGGGNASPGNLTRSADKMLGALVRFHPRGLPLEHIAKIAGVSTSSSQWRANRSSFVRCSYVTEMDNGNYRLSSFGVAAMGIQSAPDSGDQLRQFWAAAFPPSISAMLQVIIAERGRVISMDEIAARAGVSPTSSGLGSGLRELRSHGLIEQVDKRDYRLAEVLL